MQMESEWVTDRGGSKKSYASDCKENFKNLLGFCGVRYEMNGSLIPEDIDISSLIRTE